LGPHPSPSQIPVSQSAALLQAAPTAPPVAGGGVAGSVAGAPASADSSIGLGG